MDKKEFAIDRFSIAHHVEWLILMITLIGGVYVMDSKIERQIAEQSARTDRLYEMFTEVREEQSARTDKLYQMFIDLLKEKKS